MIKTNKRPLSHGVSGYNKLLCMLQDYVMRLYVTMGSLKTVSKGYLEVFQQDDTLTEKFSCIAILVKYIEYRIVKKTS